MALLNRRSSLDSNVFAEYNKIHTYCKNIVIAELFFSPHRMKYSMYFKRVNENRTTINNNFSRLLCSIAGTLASSSFSYYSLLVCLVYICIYLCKCTYIY